MDASPELAALPPEMRAALRDFAEALAAKLGDQLVCVALYGGAVQGQYDARRSDLNVLVVLSKATPAALDELAAARRGVVGLELFVLEEGELADGVEVFATKFWDLQRHHARLHGRDVLGALAISRERLVRQARRELLNLKLRLRQAFLERETRPEVLGALLKRGRTTMRVNLAALLEDTGAGFGPALRTVCEGLDGEADFEGLTRRVEGALRAIEGA